MADLCCCMAEINTTLKSSYFPIKNYKKDSNLKNIQQVDVDLPFFWEDFSVFIAPLVWKVGNPLPCSP